MLIHDEGVQHMFTHASHSHPLVRKRNFRHAA